MQGIKLCQFLIKNYKLKIVLLLLIFQAFSCANSKEQTPVEATFNHQKITGQIVKKEYKNQGLVSSGIFEYYLRDSIQDYYIKLCESKVTEIEIEKLYSDSLNTAIIEAEIKNGEWDMCYRWGSSRIPTRIGKYVVVYKIVK